MANRKRAVTLHFSRDKYLTVPSTPGKRGAELPIDLLRGCKKGKRGLSFDCLINHEMGHAREELEKALGHPVLQAFVIKSCVHIVSKLHAGGTQIAQTVKYMHNLGTLAENFDKLTKRTFLRRFGDLQPVLRLRPPVTGGHREHTPGRPHGEPGERARKYLSRGALKRLEDAGLAVRAFDTAA